jgi:serine phosphatase RsbU (regulator of sigma subunit)
MQVTVAPIRDSSGTVIGGVETFRDATEMVHDLERAKVIQKSAVDEAVPQDSPVSFTTHYIPRDIVGGDYYSIRDLGDGRYGIMLADVMGHGVAAALYTMHLSSLWNRYFPLIKDPGEFVGRVNKELAAVVKEEGSFASAICGLIDLARHEFRFVSAGGPEVVLMDADGGHACLKGSGLPLALSADAQYEETSTLVRQGDSLLLFTDGAVEVMNADGTMLGTDGLVDLLKSRGYPHEQIQMQALHKDLLMYSNAIRLEDDLTIIEVRLQ